MPKPKKNKLNRPELPRAYLQDLSVRDINEEKRTATFVAATENGVLTWGGKEYLRMSGVNLKRYRSNPIILDVHDRYTTCLAIVGKGIVKLEKALKEIHVEITFAETERASAMWDLVRGGFLKTVSVGFLPDASQTVRLGDGIVDGTGDEAITGPATIIKRWELLEISLVPVPADPACVQRGASEWVRAFGFEAEEEPEASQIKTEEDVMFEKWHMQKYGVGVEGLDEATKTTRQAEFDAWSTRQLATVSAPAAPAATTTPVAAAPEAKTAWDVRARALATTVEPKALDKIILTADAEKTDELKSEKARALILESLSKTSTPVGTPSHEEGGKKTNRGAGGGTEEEQGTGEGGEKSFADLDDGESLRALGI